MIRKKRIRKNPIKDVLFDIQSLADQLYYFELIISKSFEPKKIYFLKNLILDLLKNKIK